MAKQITLYPKIYATIKEVNYLRKPKPEYADLFMAISTEGHAYLLSPRAKCGKSKPNWLQAGTEIKIYEHPNSTRLKFRLKGA